MALNCCQITAGTEMLNRFNASLCPAALVWGVIKSSRFKPSQRGTSESCHTCAVETSAPEHIHGPLVTY